LKFPYTYLKIILGYVTGMAMELLNFMTIKTFLKRLKSSQNF